MKKTGCILLTLSALLIGACSSTHMPPANMSDAELSKSQTGQLSQKKLRVPCRVFVQCADTIRGDSSAFWKDRYYTYPLQQILTYSFQSATYAAFNQPGSEVVDAFTVYVTVPQSMFRYTGSGDCEYTLQIIVKLNEPGEKQITAFSLDQAFQGTIANYNAVPPVIYEAAKTMAYRALDRIINDPKVIRTVRRFEDK